MDRSSVINEINKILQEKNISLKINNDNISKNFKDLGTDSLQLLEVIMNIEEKFNITFPDEELVKVKSGNELIELILNNAK